jgi:uncharacterized protein (DUF924 family)
MPTADDVIDFWFGDGSQAAMQKWFTKDPAFDAEVRDRFGALQEQAARGELDRWRDTSRGSLALIVLLDQLARNLFRDDARAFATDAAALEVTQALLASGNLSELPLLQRSIALMPLMHAEDRSVQQQSLSEFGKLAAEDATYEYSLKYARMHADIVERFGRYPHRNAILGRDSTPEEVEFLKQPNSSF